MSCIKARESYSIGQVFWKLCARDFTLNVMHFVIIECHNFIAEPFGINNNAMVPLKG